MLLATAALLQTTGAPRDNLGTLPTGRLAQFCPVHSPAIFLKIV